MKQKVECSIWIFAPCIKVWEAIINPKQLEQWYAPGCPWKIPALQVGSTVTFNHTESEVLEATIIAFDSLNQLILRWEPESSTTTIITSFLLEEEDNGTRLKIVEEGFDSLPEDIRVERIIQTENGYACSLLNLKSLLEI